MKIIMLMLLAILPLHAYADFEIEDGALRSKQEQQRLEDEQKKAKVAAATAAAKLAAQEAALAATVAAVELENKSLNKKNTKSIKVDSSLKSDEVLVGSNQEGSVWVKNSTDSLRSVVNDWSVRAGWQVEWNVKDSQTQEDQDFKLGGGLRYQGSYQESITRLFNSLPVRIKVRAEFWPENDPPLLYVIKGEEQ